MRIAIVGAGASGCMCAYFLIKKGFDITIFDKKTPLSTLLPTGGGRCNLAHAEYDFMELAKNYPRGEKFLYSVFSKFGTSETISLFKEIGIETYTQDDGRIFPKSNSAKQVREAILKKINKVKFVKENVNSITNFHDGYKVKTNNAEYFFDKVIIAIGGHSGYDIVKQLGIKITEIRPSLVGLVTKQNYTDIAGISVKNCAITGISGDILFTHYGLSGPLIYKISSINAYKNYPYQLTIDLYPFDMELQNHLNKNSHKEIKNILSKFIPQRLCTKILCELGVNIDTKASLIDSKKRDLILNKIHNYTVQIINTAKGEETVTAGGISLNQINPKTFELKKIPGVYCIGEVLDIDGFCGGFNLQNAWANAYVCAEGIYED